MRAFFAIYILLLVASSAAAVTIPTVPVGNAGNAGDTEVMQHDGTSGYGAVDYNYRIGTYEVTNAQYAEFLNAKAASDPLGLFGEPPVNGEIFTTAGITRSGSEGTYTYAAVAGRENRPVEFVSWYDAIRFANWLHNGQGDGNTETGAYTLGPLDENGIPLDGTSITRNDGAQWFLPTEHEWYKAAYHKNDGPTGNYFDYPTGSDTAPTAEPPAGGSNSANYDNALMPVDTTDAGAYVDSPSPYGTFDQAGNVFEWIENPFASYRGIRGGWAATFPVIDAVHAAGRLNEDFFELTDFLPSSEAGGTGFRVATVPEPSTLWLAVLALLGLLALGIRRARRPMLPRSR